MVQKITPELTEAELVTTVTPILQEYLEHGDTNEVAVSLAHERRVPRKLELLVWSTLHC